VADRAASLNADCHSAEIDRVALEDALRLEGADFFQAVSERPRLFSGVAFFISAAQMEQMRGVIVAVEEVIGLSGWDEGSVATGGTLSIGERKLKRPFAKGVFLGYDFHLNADGAHLIEINTNAGGAFLNALLLQSQKGAQMPGEAVAQENLEQVFLDMFRNEWRLERGDAPLQTIVVLDEQPQQQYLYPEFVLAQRMFGRAGILALIADLAELEARGDGLYCGGSKVDMIYNRLTDFSLQQHPALRSAHQDNQVVLTPHPRAYARYADKRNLVRLSDADALRAMGAADAAVAVRLLSRHRGADGRRPRPYGGLRTQSAGLRRRASLEFRRLRDARAQCRLRTQKTEQRRRIGGPVAGVVRYAVGEALFGVVEGHEEVFSN